MGLPLLGETLDFFISSPSFDVHPFFEKRTNRYGRVLKTSLIGWPLVVSTDPEFNRLVFREEGRLFESCYPESFSKIFGQEDASELHGPRFKYLKGLFLNLLGSPNLRLTLLQDVEKEALDCLSSWTTQTSIELKSELSSMIFNVIAKKLISFDPTKANEDLKANFSAFSAGLISFPVNIPGTAYHRCLKGRKNVITMLKKLLAERKNSPREESRDYLDLLVEELGNGSTLLNEGMALDFMFALLYASSETPSPALALAVKFLTDHADVLEELQEEHESITRRRKEPNSGITWEEYKSMKFTHQVISETLRLANVAPVIFRKAMKDVPVNGYIIPEGWGVMMCPTAVHLSHDIYGDPLAFNPRRWKDDTTKDDCSKYFAAFGGGIRLCVGAEFTKVVMAVFLHSLVTKCRWQAVRGGNILRTPGLGFQDGYHVRLRLKE
ncbi:hypothetical protein HPP92_003161 [Vanilla planifolia]|uniref:Cytochrome P450 n=1 Tax=Vanilla planifolia TaxID=51239 RepID=A0A835RTW5_VANPL|nr:hypothetical protein HPP92_003161 [Vanilla planifolia]